MSRPDLNVWHLIARGGLTPNDSYDLSLLKEKNKREWLPVHLAKNVVIAKWLYEKTVEQGVTHDDIVNRALINNAQSIQTKYDKDLMDFFIEQGFSVEQAKKASIEPTTQSRIELSAYWLSLCDFNTFLNSDHLSNPLYTAINYSNSYFMFALINILKLQTFKNEAQSNIILQALEKYPYKIGSIYYISDRAFQLQQIIKQNFSINIAISTNTVNGVNPVTNCSIANLEGF